MAEIHSPVIRVLYVVDEMTERLSLEELQHIMGNMNVSWCTDPTDCEICASARQKLEKMIAREQEKPVKEVRDIGGHQVIIERTRG